MVGDMLVNLLADPFGEPPVKLPCYIGAKFTSSMNMVIVSSYLLINCFGQDLHPILKL